MEIVGINKTLQTIWITCKLVNTDECSCETATENILQFNGRLHADPWAKAKIHRLLIWATFPIPQIQIRAIYSAMCMAAIRSASTWRAARDLQRKTRSMFAIPLLPLAQLQTQ